MPRRNGGFPPETPRIKVTRSVMDDRSGRDHPFARRSVQVARDELDEVP